MMMGVREIDRSLEQWQMGVKDLRRRMVLAPTPRERERWYAMLLLAQGLTAAATAEALERDPHTIGRWAAAFGEGLKRSRSFDFRADWGFPPLTGVGIWCFPLRDDRFLRVRWRAGMRFRKQQYPRQPGCLAPKRCRKARRASPHFHSKSTVSIPTPVRDGPFPPALDQAQQEELKGVVQQPPATSGIELANWYWKVVRQYVSERCGVSLSRSSCLNYPHRLGFAFKRPKKRLL